MADQYILALDQGTTSTRAMLFDNDGQVVATAQKSYPRFLIIRVGQNMMRMVFGKMPAK